MSFPCRKPDLFKDFWEKSKLRWEWRADQPEQLLEWGKVWGVGSWQVGRGMGAMPEAQRACPCPGVALAPAS